MHTLQAIVADFEALDDFHLNLHELDVLNLLTKYEQIKCNTKVFNISIFLMIKSH